MAESRFKGLSILMNMRDVGIERTMKQIRAQFKTLDSEMRRSNANFKHSEKNMQSYATRTKELTKAIDVTENSMKDISNQLKKMTLEEQRSSVEAEKLRQEYSKQHRALQMYQRQLNSTEQEMKQFGTTTKQTIFSMKKINDVLGTMKRQLNIANMAFQSTEKSTSSYKNYLNQLNTVIQKHQNTIRVLEGRYQKVAREQGVMSKEALELKEKILQEKATLGQLDNQYKKTTMEAKRFAFEQKTLTASMSEIRQKMSQVAQSLTISANKFKMSGQTAQAYKARISELNNGMKQQQLIVQNLSRQYDFAKKQYGATSQEAQQLNVKLSEERLKLKELNTQLNQTTQAHNRLEMEQKQGISSMAQIRAKMSQFNDTLSLSRSNLARARESVKAYGNHLNTLKTNMSEQRVVLRELIAQYNHVATAQGRDSQEARELSSAITQQKIKMNELESELDQTTQSYKRLETEQRNAERLSSTGFGRGVQNVNKYKDSINNVGSSMRNVGSNMSLYFTLPVVAGFGAAIKTGADFEQQMARVGAIAGSSKSDLKSLSDQAVDLGAKTSLSASEVAKGMEELAALGMNTNQIMKAMPGVISAAEASGSDLATTATIMASSLNSFNLKASDSSHVADVLATAANDSAADVQYMGDALKYAGTPAHALGITLEDTSAAIEVMSNSGLEGSQAGTALRASFIRLAKPTKASQKAMDELGVSLTNSKGQFVGMPNLIGQFKSSLQGMTKEQKLAYVSQIVGTEAASGFLALIDAGPSKIKKYSDSLKDSNGASKEAADKMKDNLKGSLEQLHGAFESLGITIGKAFSPVLRKLADVVTAVVSKFSSLPTPVIVITTLFVGLVASIGPLLMLTGLLAHSIVGISEAMKLLNDTKGGAKFFSLFNGGIKGILPKIGQLLTKIPLLGSAFTLLTGPVGIVIGVIAALTAGIVYLWKTNDSFRNFVINAWNSIKDSAIAVFGFIKPYIINIWDGIKNSSIAIWNALKTAAKVTWNAIKFAVQHPIQTLKNIISGIWNFIKANSLNTWNLIKTGILNIAKSLVSLVRASFNGLKAFFTMLWNFIKNNSIRAWLAIKNSVLAIIRNFVTLSKHNFAILKGFLSALWTSIKNTAIKLWTALKIGVLAIIRTLVSTARNILNTLKNFITRLWQSIKAISIRIWTAIKNGVINAIKGMYNGVRKILANLKAFITRTWTAIKNTTIKLAKALSNGVKNIFNSLSKVTRSIFNKLKNFMSNVWRSIKNTTVKSAKSLWSGVKSVWNALSRGTRSIFNKVKNFMNNVWRNIKNTTVRYVKSLWTGVRNTFNNLYRGTRNIFNRVKNFMSNTWRSIKNTTVNMAKGLWNSVRNVFNNMSNGLKNIIGKIKGHITGMVSAVKKSLNSLIGAVNWVGGKLGVDSKIPKLSTGTESTHTQSFITNGSINKPTLATVNDKGKGNGKGRNGHQELIQRKNGSLFAPKGRDVVVPLSKGDKVINGKTTQRLQNQGFIPKFSVGTSGDDVRKRMLKDAKKHKKHNHPTFDAGEMMSGAGGAGGAFKEAWKYVTDKTKNIGKGTKKTAKSLSDGAKKMINTSKDALGAAGTWAKEKAGDLLDYVGKPGKLVDKVLKEFGVDFSMVNGEIPKMLWDAMWKRLKEGVKSLFGGWLDDASEGDGDGRYIKYLNNITTRYSPNGPPPGYPFNWAHPGIDLPYIYEKVQTPLEGKVETRNTASGFGHHIIVRAKPYDAYFGHLSKWLVKNGQHVKPGDTIGISGNTGSSSGPHLHYEMNKHGFGSMTGHSIDPVKWLKSHNGSKGGGSKAANAWKPEIKQALKANGLPTTPAYVNAWIRQIQTESGGNAGAVQGNIGDINNRTGNLARGLLQVIPPTFAANKLPGHGNIMNGLDNAMAAINYAKKRYGRTGMLRVIGHGHGYATGGLIKSAGWYNIAEGGYPEWIIPTDPSRRNDAMKMLALAAQDIDKKSSTRGNKRPNSLPKPSGSNDNDVLLQMLQAQQQQIALLTQIVTSNQTIADKDFNPTIDKYTHEQQVFNSIDKYNRQKQRKSRFKPGEVT
uniref:Minor tail protein n=1 Tax=Staphylococcus phage HS05 TaxID=3056399 RepID=A0AA50AED9_9VIRU|nr:MAG: minor tail protein [Staphylococcus phage HS05]